MSGWTSLGLQLGSLRLGTGFVLGWRSARATPDFLLLGADSRVGMPAELVLKRDDEGILVATLIQQENPAVRAAWARWARCTARSCPDHRARRPFVGLHIRAGVLAAPLLTSSSKEGR